MKDTRALEQVYRLDGAGCFLEVMLDGISIDKVHLGFHEYDRSAAPGQRMKGEIAIWLNIYESMVLSYQIKNGRLAKEAAKNEAEREAKGYKYPRPAFEKCGGTSSRRSGGPVVARKIEIAAGKKKPWILYAKQGPGHETPEGLIVMDDVEKTIMIPCDDQHLLELAFAIDTVCKTWEQLRFLSVGAPSMEAAKGKRQEAVDKAKAAASAQ